MEYTEKKHKRKTCNGKTVALYHCKLTCGIGKDACEGKRIPEGISPDAWIMYQLFSAIEDLAKAMDA